MAYAAQSGYAGARAEPRYDLTIAARVLFALTPSAAITAGAVLDAPVGNPPPPSIGPGSGQGSPLLHLGVSLGITGRFGGATASDTAPSPPRVLVGVERLVPLLQYRREHYDETPTTVAGDPSHVSVGTGDATEELPQAPRLGVDVVTASRVTIGGSASFGYARTTSYRDLLPSASAPSAVAWSLAPRVGYVLALSRAVWIWPRAGLSYAHVDGSDPERVRYHGSADVDALFVVEPVDGFGLTLGPTASLALLGRSSEPPFSTTSLADTSMTVALSGGVLLVL